jgi:hypothetical protein
MKIRPAASLVELAPAWHALGDRAHADDPVLSPEWALACGERVLALCAWEGDELCGVVPLVLREQQFVRRLVSPAVALLGSAAPPTRGVLARDGDEARVAAEALRWLSEELGHGWDVIDFGCVPQDSQLRRHGHVEPAGSQLVVRLPASFADYAEALSRLGRPAPRRGVSDLPGLVRVDRAGGLLREHRLELENVHARILAAETAGNSACAMATLRAGTTLTVLLRETDGNAAASDGLFCDLVREAIADGVTLIRLPPGDTLGERFATGSRPLVRVRVFGSSAAGRMVRGATLLRGLRKPRPADDSAPRLPVSWARLSLFRGEPSPATVAPPPGLTFSRLELPDFEALAPGRRSALCLALELSEPYCRQKWARGDVALRADLDGEPAAVLWCARGPVYVPELEREVRPEAAACYVHDVFVAPWARGRRVASALLAYAQSELLRADVARAWALVRRENTASARAFERAAWQPACEVLYARLGRRSRLLVRPADREASRLLGL